jgi:hypothetical protein
MKKILSVIALLFSSLLFVRIASAEPVGVHFQTSAVSAGGTVTVLAASANTNGVYIRTCYLLALSGTNVALIGNYPDSTNHNVFQIGSATSGNLPYPLFIPAGVGISIVATSGNSGAFNITYDIID